MPFAGPGYMLGATCQAMQYHQNADLMVAAAASFDHCASAFFVIVKRTRKSQR